MPCRNLLVGHGRDVVDHLHGVRYWSGLRCWLGGLQLDLCRRYVLQWLYCVHKLPLRPISTYVGRIEVYFVRLG